MGSIGINAMMLGTQSMATGATDGDANVGASPGLTLGNAPAVAGMALAGDPSAMYQLYNALPGLLGTALGLGSTGNAGTDNSNAIAGLGDTPYDASAQTPLPPQNPVPSGKTAVVVDTFGRPQTVAKEDATYIADRRNEIATDVNKDRQFVRQFTPSALSKANNGRPGLTFAQWKAEQQNQAQA